MLKKDRVFLPISFADLHFSLLFFIELVSFSVGLISHKIWVLITAPF